MRLRYNRQKMKESGPYDNRNLVLSMSGKYHYPSKKMFIEFLKQFKDVSGLADIWSESDLNNGTTTIHVEIKYKVKKLMREYKSFEMLLKK